MTNFRDRLQFKNVCMTAHGKEAGLVAQFILELANANPIAGYRFHILADEDATKFLKAFLSANGVLDQVSIADAASVDNITDWWNSKDIFVGFPMQGIPPEAYLDAFSTGMAVFVPFSEEKLFSETPMDYKWQTVSDLISTILAEKFTSVRSQELSLQLAEKIA